MAIVSFLFLLIFFVIIFIFYIFSFPMPYNDASRTVRYRSFPYMTATLIAFNTGVFIFWLSQDWVDSLMYNDERGYLGYISYYRKIWTYGFRETYLVQDQSIGAFVTFTSMFMHDGVFHLLFNMLYLWAFGKRIEDACGPWRYLMFYILAGVIASLGSVVLNPTEIDLPGIGASGAIAGVMGAYLILFPGEWMSCLWIVGSILRLPIIFVMNEFFRRKQHFRYDRVNILLPAWVLLIFFLVTNILPSFETVLEGREEGGVNNVAHLTGFLAGLTIFFFVRKDLLMRYLRGRAL